MVVNHIQRLELEIPKYKNCFGKWANVKVEGNTLLFRTHIFAIITDFAIVYYLHPGRKWSRSGYHIFRTQRLVEILNSFCVEEEEW